MMTHVDSYIIHEDYVKDKDLGSGSDGYVVLYKHRRTTLAPIAVKFPKSCQEGETEHTMRARRQQLSQELTLLKKIGKHANIVELLGWDDLWAPEAPALFFEYCPLGDACNYYISLYTTLKHTPEITLWKLLADISKGLNYLHNGFANPLIHGDIKVDNILVQLPRGEVCEKGQVVLLPTFKLADFSRSTVYYAGYDQGNTYRGTWTFAPPIAEQNQEITPASDIWSLGAVVQFFAYGREPIQDQQEFVDDLRAQGITSADLPEPGSPDAVMRMWWRKWPVVYRPLMDASPLYSIALNNWYAMCMRVDMKERISSAELFKWFIPIAERQIRILALKW